MSSNGSERRELYRDPSRAKISGVCAGISDYFGIEVWVVRIIAVSALILFQIFPVLFAYGVAHFILDPKPGAYKQHKSKHYKTSGTYASAEQDDATSGFAGDVPVEKATVQQIWKKGRIPGQMIRKVNRRFKNLERRLQAMESYVTSRQFQLRKEFRDL